MNSNSELTGIDTQSIIIYFEYFNDWITYLKQKYLKI